MSITPNRPFGSFAATSAQPTREDRPQAQAWLNIGYSVPVTYDDGTTEEKFISLPVGIPLDTMKAINITSRNAEFAELQAAQNGLLKELQDAAAGMTAGETQLVNLQLQLRRVNDPVVAPTVTEASPFARKAPLFAVINGGNNEG